MVMFLKSKIRDAIERGDIPRLETLLKEPGASPQMDIDDTRGTCLHFAVSSSDVPIAVIEYLLPHFPDVNSVKDFRGRTPLHRAVDAKKIDAVVCLLGKGADPNIRSKYGGTSMDYARSNKYHDIIRVLEPFMRDPLDMVRAFMPESKKTPLALPAPGETSGEEPTAQETSVQQTPAQETGGWHLIDVQTVAHVTAHPALDHKITDIFNFAARERLRIVANLKTGADQTLPAGFDDLADKTPLHQALAQLRKLGGQTDDAVLDRALLPKTQAVLASRLAGGPGAHTAQG